MQEQGKRLLLAFALGIGVLLLWNVVFHKDEPLSDSVGVWEPTLAITWTDDTGGGAFKNADPTPYETVELAAEEASKLYPGKEIAIVPFPDSVADGAEQTSGS